MTVGYTYLKLDPIGLIFVVFFAVVLVIQVIGMLIHRWGTISHIISTTKLPLFNRNLQENDDKQKDQKLVKDLLAVSKSLQMPAPEARSSSDSGTARNTRFNSRRMTVRQLTKSYKDTDGGERPVLDLQKNFLARMQTAGQSNHCEVTTMS